jgi:diguanylate cyclase (GGDEF)-like protein
LCEMEHRSAQGSEGVRRHQMARYSALLFGGGAVITALGLLLPHQPEVDAGGLTLVAAASGLIAALMLVGGERLSSLYLFLPAAGTTLVSLALLFNGERNGGPAGGDEMYYLWVVLYAAYFLGRVATAVHVALIAIAYGVTLEAIDPGPIGVSRWLSTVGLVVGAALVVHLLSERVGRLVAELQLAARTDGLTGLPNRRAFEEHFEREVARATRTRRPFALLLADIDRFKELNDRHGHVAGDAALSELGRLLPTLLRRNEMPARVGGDEFAVLLPEMDTEEAESFGTRLVSTVGARLHREDAPLRLSFGVAAFGHDGYTLDDLTRAADRALYAAKRTPGAQATSLTSSPPSPGTASPAWPISAKTRAT